MFVTCTIAFQLRLTANERDESNHSHHQAVTVLADTAEIQASILFARLQQFLNQSSS